jgi:serine/threonine protein kinase
MTDSVQQQQRVVGPYLLERRLGVGGMAEVWLARHLNLETQAAVKFLNATYAGHPEVEARFLDEGKLQAKLTQLNAHGANILPVFDYMSVEGRSYLVMRYINGFGLDARIGNPGVPLPIPEALTIARDVLGAMGFAHSQGVIHRDIKPSNVLLEGGKRAYLMDFGIALARDAASRHTRVGTVLGTMHYMSPEQIEAPRDVTPASDIYSFGCMLYETLTGQTPFDPQNKVSDLELMRMHVHDAPLPPSHLNPAIPRELEEVVLRCLAKRAIDRFPDCETVQNHLDGRASASPSGQRTVLVDTTALRGTKLEISALPKSEDWTAKSSSLSAPVSPKPLPPQPPAKKAAIPDMEEMRRQKQKKRNLGILGGAFAAALALSGGIALWQHRKPAPAPVQQQVVTPQPPATGATGNPAATTAPPVAKKPHSPPPPTTKPNQQTSPARQTPPAVAPPASGVMVWQGSVSPNQPITFYSTGRVSEGQMKGTVFPSRPLTITIHPARMFDIQQQPSASNGWKLILNPHFSGDMQVTINWSTTG